MKEYRILLSVRIWNFILFGDLIESINNLMISLFFNVYEKNISYRSRINFNLSPLLLIQLDENSY